VVITNQSGLARGYFPPSLLEEVHEKMRRELAAKGAHVDGIYLCPHHPDARLIEYRKSCECRKPRPGLLKTAAKDLHLDLLRSYVVGDRWTDVKTAANCRATSVLVLTGYGRGELDYIGPGQQEQPAYVAEDLQKAVYRTSSRLLNPGLAHAPWFSDLSAHFIPLWFNHYSVC
jgi:D-glycero-D-manno-heptose 1,7-bisphosphate phosphatase